jgi:hypothetical protein
MIRRDVNPAAIAKQICDFVGGLSAVSANGTDLRL